MGGKAGRLLLDVHAARTAGRDRHGNARQNGCEEAACGLMQADDMVEVAIDKVSFLSNVVTNERS